MMGDRDRNNKRWLSYSPYREDIFRKVSKILIKKYQLGNILGKGGDAVAVTLRDNISNHTCHILLIHSIFKKEMKKYFNIVNILRHQNYTYQIVNEFETEIDNHINKDNPVIMIFSVIDRLNPLTIEDIGNIDISKQMLEIIKYMSNNYIWHADLDNIGNWMICKSYDKVKIIDYNFSQIINPNDDDDDFIETLIGEVFWETIESIGITDIDSFISQIVEECKDLEILKNVIFLLNICNFTGIDEDSYNFSIGSKNPIITTQLKKLKTHIFNNLGVESNLYKLLDVVVTNKVEWDKQNI
jgi:serine/threonine protein kinase